LLRGGVLSRFLMAVQRLSAGGMRAEPEYRRRKLTADEGTNIPRRISIGGTIRLGGCARPVMRFLERGGPTNSAQKLLTRPRQPAKGAVIDARVLCEIGMIPCSATTGAPSKTSVCCNGSLPVSKTVRTRFESGLRCQISQFGPQPLLQYMRIKPLTLGGIARAEARYPFRRAHGGPDHARRV
jgi:hypothetical protein